MSAWVVSKPHIDLLVRAALHYGQDVDEWPGARFQFGTEEAGCFGLDRQAECRADDGQREWLSPSQFGQMLVDENVASVSHRYPGDDVDAGELPGPIDAYYMGPYVYADPGYVLSPGEVFKAINCLDYQSCEHDGWQASAACAALDALRREACSAVAGYDSAPWGFDEIPAVPR